MTKSDVLIRQTRDYKKFQVLPENRVVNESLRSTKELKRSMEKLGFLPIFPIYCVPNGTKLLVKSGHHRLHFAEKLGLPVFYVVWKNVCDIYDLEFSTTRWTILNWLQSRVHKNKEYRDVQRYCEETGIPISTAIQLLSDSSKPEMGGGPTLINFKMGNFVKGETEHAEKVADLVVYLKGIGVPFASSRAFVNALSSAIKVDGFEIKVFKKKAKTHTYIFQKQASKNEYLQIIESVYNHANQKKISIKFEAMRIK